MITTQTTRVPIATGVHGTRVDGTGQPHARVRARLARARCESAIDGDRLTWRHLLDREVAEALGERDPARLRGELVQVAAVVLSWIEDLDHRADVALADLIRAAASTSNRTCPAAPVVPAVLSTATATVAVAGRRVR